MLNVDCTRPSGGCKGNLPYGALPHVLSADPRLTATDVRVAAALLFWARSKAQCWPADRTIAARVGRSPGTVQRCLRRLEAVGWIRREKTAANRTGRLIVLAWRGAGARSLPTPMIVPPAAPARDEGDVVVKGDASKELAIEIPERPRPDTCRSVGPRPHEGPSEVSQVPAPSWAIPAEQKAAWIGSNDPILKAEATRRLAPAPPRPSPPASVPELLARIRESPGNVAAAAELLAQDLGDRKSWNGFHAACRRAWEGGIPPAALVTAWREATSGRARSPGALFMSVLRRESRAG